MIARALKMHWEDIGGTEFEEIVFMYIKHVYPDDDIKWLGEGGGDQGRDVWRNHRNPDGSITS